MRIDLNSGAGAAQTSLEKPGSARPASETTSNAGESKFSSQPASLSKNLSGLTATALAAPEVRQAKVQALQQQIGDGSYQVSSSQIAAAMFQHMVG